MAVRPELPELILALKDLTWSDVKRMAIHLDRCVNFTLLMNIDEEGRPVKARVMQAMNEWLDKDSEASWAKVVSALQAISNNTLASRIETQYCASVQATTTPHPSPPSSNSGLESGNSGTAVSAPRSQTMSSSAASLTPAFDHSAAVSQDSSVVDRIQVKGRHAAQLQTQFVTVFTHTKICFVGKEAESGNFLSKFRITLTTLPLSNRYQHLHLLKTEKDRINKADVEGIFDILEPYWNYVDYPLLKYIINEFGTSELQKEMDKYIADLEMFEKNTTVQDYDSADLGEVSVPADFKTVEIMQARDPKKCSLYEVRQFQNQSVDRSALKAYAVLRKRVSCSSVTIVLAFPPEAYEELSEVFDMQFMTTHKIVSVVFTDRAPHKNITPSAPMKQKSVKSSKQVEEESQVSIASQAASSPVQVLHGETALSEKEEAVMQQRLGEQSFGTKDSKLHHAKEQEDLVTGYDCVFVKQPPKETQTKCPICLLVLRKPSQMSCCGYVYCTACIQKVLRIQNVCPTCKTPNPTSFLDKRLKQSLSGFHVYCIHRDKEGEGGGEGGGGGCKWMGELGELERHLNKNPSTENQLKGCPYAVIKCKFCSEFFKRLHITSHQSNYCTKREHTCHLCGYSGAYMYITKTHMQRCGHVPSQCPHCKKTFERQKLQDHIDNDCILAPISCTFKLVGCRKKSPRIKMAGHIHRNCIRHAKLLVKYAKEHQDHNVGQYLPMVTSCVDILSELSSENATLSSENATLSSKNHALSSNNETLSSTNAALFSENATFYSENETLSSKYATLSSENEMLSSNNAALSSKNKTLSSKNETVSSEIETLSSKNETLSSEIGTLSSKNETLSSEIGTLSSKNETLSSEIEMLSSKNANLSSENEMLSSKNRMLSSSNERLAYIIFLIFGILCSIIIYMYTLCTAV